MGDTMHYKNYYGSVHFDNKSLVFYGKVEFIRALISYEATNIEDLETAFKEAVNDYLELLQNNQSQGSF